MPPVSGSRYLKFPTSSRNGQGVNQPHTPIRWESVLQPNNLIQDELFEQVVLEQVLRISGLKLTVSR